MSINKYTIIVHHSSSSIDGCQNKKLIGKCLKGIALSGFILNLWPRLVPTHCEIFHNLVEMITFLVLTFF